MCRPLPARRAHRETDTQRKGKDRGKREQTSRRSRAGAEPQAGTGPLSPGLPVLSWAPLTRGGWAAQRKTPSRSHRETAGLPCRPRNPAGPRLLRRKR